MSYFSYNSAGELSILVNTIANKGGPFSKDEIKILEVFRMSGYGDVRLVGHDRSRLIELSVNTLEGALEDYNNLKVHYSPMSILCLQFELAKRKTCTSPKS